MDYTYADDSLTLHTDMYQINMMQTYWELGEQIYMLFLNVTLERCPLIMATQFCRFRTFSQLSRNLTFTESDIAYLREVEEYPEDFLTYLANFEFKCTVRSALEGDLVFNNEPLIQIEGPLAQCQLVETALLNMVNFQTLIATKAARIKSVIGDDPFIEFGTRRAQELDAAIWGTRAAYIGGRTRQVMFVLVKFLVFRLVGLTPIHWFSRMEMIMKHSWRMPKHIGIVFSLC